MSHNLPHILYHNVMYRKSNSLYMMRFLCIDLIHYPPLKERPPFMRRQKSRPFSDQLSKPFRLCGSHNLPQVYISRSIE